MSKTTHQYTGKSKISGVLKISDFHEMGGMKVVFDAWNSTNLVVFEHA
jgi:hypothetical protein